MAAGIPLTPQGKVDREVLPVPRIDVNENAIPARDKIEKNWRTYGRKSWDQAGK